MIRTTLMSSSPDGRRASGTLIFSTSSAAAKLPLDSGDSAGRTGSHVRRVNTRDGVKVARSLRSHDNLVAPACADGTELAARGLQLLGHLGDRGGLGVDRTREAGEERRLLLVSPACERLSQTRVPLSCRQESLSDLLFGPVEHGRGGVVTQKEIGHDHPVALRSEQVRT